MPTALSALLSPAPASSAGHSTPELPDGKAPFDTAPAIPQGRRERFVATLSRDEQRIIRHVGLRVLGARNAKRLTRPELAMAAGINASHLSTIERGTTNPSLLTLHRLARALGTTVVALVEPVRG